LQYDEQQEYIGQLRIYMSQQKRLRGQEEDRDKRVDDRKKQIESISNKNTKAIETCSELIQHCNRLKTKFGLNEVDADEAAAQAQKELKEQQRQEQLTEKLNDGRLQMVEHKKDKDEMMTIGGGGKGKKNRNRNKKTDAQETASTAIPIDLGIISKFNVVMLSPPTDASQLDAKIEDLKKKMVQLQEDGEAALNEEKEKMLDQIEKLVDEEIKAEMDLELAGAEDEEEKSHERMARRGGRGRGGRGGAAGGRGGRQRFQDEDDEEAERKRKLKKKGQPKAEFEEASDEEGETTNVYSKPKAGGQRVGAGKKKKQQLVAEDDDDEEYPSLL